MASAANLNDVQPAGFFTRALADADPAVRKAMSRKTAKPGVIDADWLRQVCLDAGADDLAFASVENPELATDVLRIQDLVFEERRMLEAQGLDWRPFQS